MLHATSEIEPKKILLLLHGSIGDVTRALPLAGLLRQRFPEAKLVWSVEPPSKPLVELCPAVDEIIVFDRPRGLAALPSFLRSIRRAKFDLVLDLQRHLKSGLISRWSGAPVRLGFHHADAKECNWLFNNRHIPAMGKRVSKLKHYLKFAEALGVAQPQPAWNFSLTEADRARCRHLLRQAGDAYAVLFVGSRWESKLWFAAQISAAADALQRRYGLSVVFLGGPSDRGLAGEAAARTGVAVVDLVGATSLREAVGIIAEARLCIGPDTGLMHISAAVGTPVISLWGATDPVRTGPHGFDDLVIRGRADCSPCYRRHCSIGRICMQSIQTEAIMAKVGGVMERSRDIGRGAEETHVPIH